MARGAKDRLSDVRRVHRHFLYLDGVEVLSSLASLRGGDVTEILDKSLKEAGGNAGLKFSLFGAGLNFGGKGKRQTQHEVRLRQTVHSAVTVLQEKLYEQDGIGRLVDCRKIGSDSENLVVEFEARVRLPANWGPSERQISRLGWPLMSKLARQARTLAEASDDGLVAYAELGPPSDDGSNRAVLSLREKYLVLTKAQDFGRRATVIGQVEAVTANDEQLLLDRDASGEFVLLATTDTPYAHEGEPVRAQSDPGGDEGAPPGTGGPAEEGPQARFTRAEQLAPSSVAVTDAEGTEPEQPDSDKPVKGRDGRTAGPRPLDARVLVRPLCIFR